MRLVKCVVSFMVMKVTASVTKTGFSVPAAKSGSMTAVLRSTALWKMVMSSHALTASTSRVV